MALYQHLTDREIDAFYDIESLRAGQFDTIILNQIAVRPYFLLVLTPGTLERCREPEDWLRREIEQAISTRRVIVPVHTPNFDFGDLERLLPDGLGDTVRRFNGQELPQRWFKFAVQQLVEEFLLPREASHEAVTAADQAVVDDLLHLAQSAPKVTSGHLSAQEYFERAFARPSEDWTERSPTTTKRSASTPTTPSRSTIAAIARRSKGDLDGAIADYDEAIPSRPPVRHGVQQSRQCPAEQG